MKIDVLFPYDNGEQDRFHYFQYRIKMEDQFDVELISRIIKVGDIVRDNNSYFTTVIAVDFDAQQKTLEINGRQLFTNKVISFGTNKAIEILIHQENDHRLKKMNKMIEDIPRYEMYKKSVSSDHIQNEGFRILHEYINRKPYKVVFGNDVISSLNDEQVKVVFVCWKFIKTSNKKLFKILAPDTHKYKNANIIVVWKGNENYEELKTYGGIVGVLY